MTQAYPCNKSALVLLNLKVKKQSLNESNLSVFPMIFVQVFFHVTAEIQECL